MGYNVILVPEFKRQLKRLSKRYKSIVDDVDNLVNSLLIDPFQGTEIRKGIRKVRISIKSKGRGKSGGGRVIYVAIIDDIDSEITLINIYDKSEKVDLSESEWNEIFDKYGNL